MFWTKNSREIENTENTVRKLHTTEIKQTMQNIAKQNYPDSSSCLLQHWARKQGGLIQQRSRADQGATDVIIQPTVSQH